MASNPNYCDITPEIEALAAQSLQNSSIDAGDYVRYDVKRGLRDLNGKGVLAGLTEISDIIAKKMACICSCWAACPTRRSWRALKTSWPTTVPCPATSCGMSF